MRGHDEVLSQTCRQEYLSNTSPQSSACVLGAIDGCKREHPVIRLDIRIWKATRRLTENEWLAETLALEVSMVQVPRLDAQSPGGREAVDYKYGFLICRR